MVARDKGTHWVITANRTDDGAPVYFDDAHQWALALSAAHATADDVAKDALLAKAAEQERTVCDPYAFRVVIGSEGIEATTARERIRSRGPTTPLRRPDAAPQPSASISS